MNLITIPSIISLFASVVVATFTGRVLGTMDLTKVHNYLPYIEIWLPILIAIYGIFMFLHSTYSEKGKVDSI